MDEDYQLALLLQREFNEEEPEFLNKSTGKDKEKKPSNKATTSSLVDPQWEFVDPTPDIHVLFLQFNERFFWKKLHGVEVKWSPRMTSCAGVCVYQGRSGFCSVRLSLPLLKLRPRKDLVETLLHEMIHAFLFVTKNNRDRDGHGPEFHKHMNRINQEAGTHISVYHSFHEEVRVYQQHWWRCDGPCQHRPPFFGMVRRSMNRAPGRADNWWAQHEATCGGKFIKVREPEDTKKKQSVAKKKTPGAGNPIKGQGGIRSFFPTSGSPSKQGSNFGKPSNLPSSSLGSSSNNPSNGLHQPNLFKKPTMSNVRGFGTDSSSLFKPVVNPPVNNVFGFGDFNGQPKSNPSGTKQSGGTGYILGGKGKPPFPKGMLANKGSGTLVVSSNSTQTRNTEDSSSGSSSSQPSSFTTFAGTGHVLGKAVPAKPGRSESQIRGEPSKRTSPNSFHDLLPKKMVLDVTSSNSKTCVASQPVKVNCPVCNEKVLESLINSHLDTCINLSSSQEDDSDTAKVVVKPDIIVLSDSEDEDSTSGKTSPLTECPGCCKKVSESHLESHLSLCLSNSFEEDSIVDVTPKDGGKANCPICGETFPIGEMDQHVDNCASCSIQDISHVFDEDFSDEEEDAAVGSPSIRVSDSGERLYPCPCCLALIETSKMNNHLDRCTV